MQLQWVGQVVCPPGQVHDQFGRCYNPFDPFGLPAAPFTPPPPPVVQVPTGVVVAPAPPPSEERSKTLVYAAVIVASGIVAAVALSRFAS